MSTKTDNSFVNGLVAGSIGAFAVYPIDVVKTRMQNQVKTNEILYKNGADCFKKLWAQGKLKPFYRGCLPQMIGVAPEKAVKLFAYKQVINGHESEGKYHLLGGLTAGTCQVMITSPYEMIKINRQMNIPINYKMLMNPSKLYQGASACFLRDIPFSGIYFPTYWYVKNKVLDTRSNNKEFNSFAAGMIAGVPAAYLCTPADVIKTRMQTLRKEESSVKPKMLETTKAIFKNEGFKAFWKGGLWRIARSAPQFGVTLAVFEYMNN